jgi:adenosine deaminase
MNILILGMIGGLKKLILPYGMDFPAIMKLIRFKTGCCMDWYDPSPTLQKYKTLPKVELHRHLEGSLRLSTLQEIAQQFNLPLPHDSSLAALVQIQRSEPLTFANFLSKFTPLRQFYQSPQVITRVVRETVEDAAADHILHLEMRFTPVALSRARGFDLAEVMDWVIESAACASRDYGVSVSLIASINRHESLDLAEQVVSRVIDRRAAGIIALDLAGNEAEFSALPFAGLIKEAKRSGLFVTVHAGEWNGAHNVREAIEVLEADRIGHGVRVLEDETVVALARERGVVFETCLTSNLQSGVVSAPPREHPLRAMLKAGLNITLNTDDPGISGITLSDELCLAVNTLQISQDEMNTMTLNAARGSFLPAGQKSELIQKLEKIF